MDLDDDAIERIGATIRRLRQSEQLHGRGSTPLRLYRTRDGEFVRVLDDDTAPLTPELLRAIEVYTRNGSVADVPVQEEQDTDMASEQSTDPNPKAIAQPAPANTELKAREIGDSNGISPVALGCVEADDGNEISIVDNDISMDDIPEVVVPVATLVEEETPSSLVSAGIDVGAWLNGESRDLQATTMEDEHHETTPQPEAASFVSTTTGDSIETLMLRWPREICERTRLCYGATRDPSLPPRCVVYWLRNTLRVTHGNFSLAASMELGKQYQLPVVALYLAPSSIMYPVRHASGINDALTRWSVAEVRTRLRDHHNIEMIAYTPQDIGNEAGSSTLDSGSALYLLLDAFHPAAVVTDDGFSLTARREADSVRQFLHTRVRASWSLLAVDSTTCVPFQSLSEAIRKSLSIDTAPFLTDDEFTSEYMALSQHRNHFSAPLKVVHPPPNYQTSIRATIKDTLQAAMKKVQVEEIMWDVVEEMNAQSASSIAAASERIGLQRLEALVTAIGDRPAIQQELQGSGILSLVPFVRHGSIFSGYVLDKLATMIASMPRPTDAKSRKAFATLKVLRSRASSHLAKERDYDLYLSLWATRHLERDMQLNGQVIPFRALSSFKTNLSELDTYKHILPTWISPNKNLGSSSSTTPVYDPYQLESGRTDDPYWNEIQLFLIEHRYVHPLVMVYWAFWILQWSISTRAGIATIEALLDKCSLGSTHSPDASFSVWTSLFRIGKTALDPTDAAFVERVEAELSVQQKLQFRN